MRKMEEICSHLTHYHFYTLLLLIVSHVGNSKVSAARKYVLSTGNSSRGRKKATAMNERSLPHSSAHGTVSLLHMNLHGTSFQRQEHVFHRSQAWEKLQLALCLLLLTVLRLYHLPPPLPPPVGNSSCLFTRCQTLYASIVLYYSTVLFKVL